MSDMLREMDHGPSALPAGSQLTLFNSSTNVEIMARVKTRNRCDFDMVAISNTNVFPGARMSSPMPLPAKWSDGPRQDVMPALCRLRNVEVQWIYGNPLDYDDLSAKIDVTRWEPIHLQLKRSSLYLCLNESSA